MTAKQLSIWEKRKLFRIKLLFFGVIIVFTIQFILPLARTKQAWPLLRWDMFSYEINPPAETGSITSYELVAYDNQGQAHRLLLDELYASTQITAPAATAESILAYVEQDVDLTVQSQTRHAVLQRLSYLTGTEIVEAELWLRQHDYDLTKQQHPDMDTPTSAELILRLTPDETITLDTSQN